MSDARTQQDWFNSAPWIDSESADIDAYVATLKEFPRYDLKQKLHEWHNDGVVIFENVVDRALIDKVNADVATILAKHRQYHVVVDGSNDVFEKFRFLDKLSETQVREYNLRLVDIHNKSYNACLLSMVPEAVSFLSHVFGSPPALLQSLTFLRGSEQPLHQDFPYVFRQRDIAKLAAFWIPLEDIHPDSGPLIYYKGSHNVGEVGFFDWGDGYINDFSRFEFKGKAIEFTKHLARKVDELQFAPFHFLPKKGDLLIWHGALIHGGSRIVNPSLTRKSFVGHYTALDSHYALARHRFDRGYVLDAPEARDIGNYAIDRAGLARRAQRNLKRMYWRLHAKFANRADRSPR